jgi:diaminopimelate decarboxylase
MHLFQYQHDELYAEQVPVKEIADKVGTPAYIYSYNTLLRHFNAFDGAFEPLDHLVCFAVKANSNLAILKSLALAGAGMDIVSGGELYRALKAGVEPSKIVYAGVGKTRPEMEYALKSGVLIFNVESSAELQLLNRVAGELGIKARVALRVNPDVDPLTHPYISTGLKKNKFGIGISRAIEEYQAAAELENIQVLGVHKHIGSQITEVGPFVDSLEKVVELIKQLRTMGLDIRYLNLGGGLGITYNDETPPSPSQFAQALIPLIKELGGCKVILEPGRVIMGNAGILVTRVIYTKSTMAKNFVIVDAGMNDLLRPSLYNAYHKIIPVHQSQRPEIEVDVVGPICESGDFLAQKRSLPEFRQAELMAVMSAGSYGFSMSSNYNSRMRAAEVLVKDDRYFVVRQREMYENLIQGEQIPDFLLQLKQDVDF